MLSRTALSAVELLLVDDNAHMRALLRTVLRAVGISRIREASDGEDALAVLKIRAADVVITDFLMAPMDGLTLVRKLRHGASPAPNARIIMLSGYGDRFRVAAARDAGADEFLVKPISTRALLARIEAVLTKGRSIIDVHEFRGPDRRRRDAGPAGAERRLCDDALIGGDDEAA
ncbi:MAG: response regulator transcription factor [Hyphomonadaceae bacterium]